MKKQKEKRELRVENVSRLLDIMANGVSPDQFARELTMNSIEAIKRTKSGKGKIHWGIDPIYKKENGIEKLMIVDTGDGMTAQDMENHLGTLAVEGGNKNHGEDGNFGVGGKISALKQNPYGVIYKSKKNGQCYQMTISNQNGLYMIDGPDKISSKKLPEQLRKVQSGTVVTLLGKSKNENTARRKKVSSKRNNFFSSHKNQYGFKSLIQNLNRKFFEIPQGITLTADDSNDSQGGTKLRTIVGMKGFFNKQAISKGVVTLSNVEIFWWIQPEDFVKKNGTLLGGEGGAKGHIAIIYKGEVYMRPAPSANWLQKFSILAGGNQIFLYINPLYKNIRADITRSGLKIDGQDIPLEDIAAEFKDKMPRKLQDFMDTRLGDCSSKDFKQRLKKLMDKIKIPKFRKDKSGNLWTQNEEEYSYRDGNEDLPGSQKGEQEWRPSEGHIENPGNGGGTGGEKDETYYSTKGGKNKATEDGRSRDYPNIIWLSRYPEDSNIGQREEGDMEDRIGRYVMNNNTLFINADFRLIHSVIKYWKNKLKVTKKSEITVIRRAVHRSYELTLADAIIHTRHLARTDGGEGWTEEEVKRILEDDKVLTAISSGMYHPTSTLKSEIKNDLGRVGGR